VARAIIAAEFVVFEILAGTVELIGVVVIGSVVALVVLLFLDPAVTHVMRQRRRRTVAIHPPPPPLPKKIVLFLLKKPHLIQVKRLRLDFPAHHFIQKMIESDFGLKSFLAVVKFLLFLSMFFLAW
jgi:hypothetical protein